MRVQMSNEAEDSAEDNLFQFGRRSAPDENVGSVRVSLRFDSRAIFDSRCRNIEISFFCTSSHSTQCFVSSRIMTYAVGSPSFCAESARCVPEHTRMLSRPGMLGILTPIAGSRAIHPPLTSFSSSSSRFVSGFRLPGEGMSSHGSTAVALAPEAASKSINKFCSSSVGTRVGLVFRGLGHLSDGGKYACLSVGWPVTLRE
jgi:hypothetical protein